MKNKIPMEIQLRGGPESVLLGDVKVEEESNMFMMDVYSGKAVPFFADIWFAAILEGIEVDGNIGNLEGHDSKLRIGFTKKADIKLKPTVSLTGEFLDNDDALKIKKESRKGFPFQSSGVFAVKGRQNFQFVENREKMMVNGVELEGPGVLYHKSTLREASFVVLGRDDQTSAVALSTDSKPIDVEALLSLNKKEDPVMDPVTPTTPPATPATPATPVGATEAELSAAQTKGAEEARAAFKQTLVALKAEFPKEPEFAFEQAELGHNVIEARSDFLDVIKKRDEVKLAAEENGGGENPVDTGASDDQQNLESKKLGFMETVQKLSADKKIPMDQAMKLSVDADPEGHQTWLTEQQSEENAPRKSTLTQNK